jgi:hypothetical protein
MFAGLLGGVLIQRHDIGTRLSQEALTARHQPAPGHAAQQQASHVLDGQCGAAGSIFRYWGDIDVDIRSADYQISPIRLMCGFRTRASSRSTRNAQRFCM